ncbi:MAG: c-type cytochrome [Bryobacteraceae bacterium]
MKRMLKFVLLPLLAIVAAGAVYVATHKPAQRPVTDLVIARTPERLARGEYLARNVSACLHCHTDREEGARNHPAKGPEGAGGHCFTPEMGFPGHVCAANITSSKTAGIGAWSDDEILRAIREGVSKDGRALFPIMPYSAYRSLPDEDAYAIVAYLRTLAPEESKTPPAKIDFPVSFFIERVPRPVTEPVAPVAPSDPLAYGKHMATIAGCSTCHGEDFSGGEEFPLRQGVVRASNITPGTDLVPEEADAFVRIFHAYANGELPPGVSASDHTVMPWNVYAGMREDDLRAIHAYLRSLPAVKKQVQTYGAAEGK